MMQVMMTMMKMDKKFWCIAKSFLDGIQHKVRSDGHLGSKVWLVGPISEICLERHNEWS